MQTTRNPDFELRESRKKTRDDDALAGVPGTVSSITPRRMGDSRPVHIQQLTFLLESVRQARRRPGWLPEDAAKIAEFEQWIETRSKAAIAEWRQATATPPAPPVNTCTALVPVEETPRQDWIVTPLGHVLDRYGCFTGYVVTEYRRPGFQRFHVSKDGRDLNGANGPTARDAWGMCVFLEG